MSEFGEFNLPRVARGHEPCCVLNVLASFEMASFHPLPRRFISIISWQLDTQPLPTMQLTVQATNVLKVMLGAVPLLIPDPVILKPREPLTTISATPTASPRPMVTKF